MAEGLIARIESCGLMVSVGYWVLEESCRQFAAWQSRGIMQPLSVNLLAFQLMQSLPEAFEKAFFPSSEASETM